MDVYASGCKTAHVVAHYFSNGCISLWGFGWGGWGGWGGCDNVNVDTFLMLACGIFCAVVSLGFRVGGLGWGGGGGVITSMWTPSWCLRVEYSVRLSLWGFGWGGWGAGVGGCDNVNVDTFLLLRSELFHTTSKTFLLLRFELCHIISKTFLLLRSELFHTTSKTFLLLRFELCHIISKTFLLLRSELFHTTSKTFLLLRFELCHIISKTFLLLRSELFHTTSKTFLLLRFELCHIISKTFLLLRFDLFHILSKTFLLLRFELCHIISKIFLCKKTAQVFLQNTAWHPWTEKEKTGNGNCAGAMAACKLTKKKVKIRTPKSKVSRARNPERFVTFWWESAQLHARFHTRRDVYGWSIYGYKLGA